MFLIIRNKSSYSCHISDCIVQHSRESKRLQRVILKVLSEGKRNLSIYNRSPIQALAACFIPSPSLIPSFLYPLLHFLCLFYFVIYCTTARNHSFNFAFLVILSTWSNYLSYPSFIRGKKSKLLQKLWHLKES